MMLARIIAPIHTLGPGRRVGMWVQGCSKNCKGCISKELQEFDKTKDVPVHILIHLIINEANRNDCHRITISGGDPFEQAEELYVLLKGIREFFSDILVYTGYTHAEIKNSEIMRKCLQYIDVLVDGRYVESQNIGKSRIYGSNNQKIIFLNRKKEEEYVEYDKQERKLETFIHNNKVIIVGIQERRINHDK